MFSYHACQTLCLGNEIVQYEAPLWFVLKFNGAFTNEICLPVNSYLLLFLRMTCNADKVDAIPRSLLIRLRFREKEDGLSQSFACNLLSTSRTDASLSRTKLCPRCVPARDTVSPSGRMRTFSQFTSASALQRSNSCQRVLVRAARKSLIDERKNGNLPRKLGQPWARLSTKNSSIVLPLGAVKSKSPVLLS
jgi:hypothetical protein